MAENPWMQPIRDIGIRVTLRLRNPNGSTHTVWLTQDDIVSYTINESSGISGFTLGTTVAASYTLEIDNSAGNYEPYTFYGAEVDCEINIYDNGSTRYYHFGVWYVDDVIAPEQSAIITVTGMDALGTKLESVWTPYTANTYLYSVVKNAVTACGVSLNQTVDQIPNSDLYWDGRGNSPLSPSNIGTVTVRQLVSILAANAGGFARMTRDGKLMVVPYSQGTVTEHYLAPSVYFDLTLTGVEPFLFNCLEADYWSYDISTIEDNPPEVYHTTATLDSRITSDASNTIQMQAPNIKFIMVPEFIANTLRGLSSEAGSVSFIGDPRWLVGDTYYVTDLQGRMHKLVCTGQTVKYNGGLTMSISCQLPSAQTKNSGSFNVTRPFINNYGQIITQYDIMGENGIEIEIGTTTEFVVQPQNVTTTAGRDVNFEVEVSPVPTSFEWLYRTSVTSQWIDIADADFAWISISDTLDIITVTATANMNGYQFMYHVIGESGYNTDAFSDIATLTVT